MEIIMIDKRERRELEKRVGINKRTRSRS